MKFVEVDQESVAARVDVTGAVLHGHALRPVNDGVVKAMNTWTFLDFIQGFTTQISYSDNMILMVIGGVNIVGSL